MKIFDQLYIDGEWVAPSHLKTIEVIDSTTEQPFATVALGSPADVDLAVSAARRATVIWESSSAADRAAKLCAIAEGLEARTDELVDAIVREVGIPVKLAIRLQVELAISDLITTAEAITTYAFDEVVGSSVIVREAVGVVGCITPWNYPLHQATAKVGAAIAAGCTVILKPSEVAPISAFILAEAVNDADLPKGVFNLVTGFGSDVGEAIAAHAGIDMVSFTGSTKAGRRVAELAAKSVKRVTLELGGKSPSVLLLGLDDDMLAKAVRDTVGKCFLNSGQTCNAMTRMVVPRSIIGQVEELVVSAVERFSVGDPFAESTRLGPLASAKQRDRVVEYIRAGIESGAKLIVGGPDRPPGLDHGFYVQPTVFSDVPSSSSIVEDEIFGPVLVIQAYDTEDEAVQIANDTIYGLAAAVWAPDIDTARSVARQIRAGQVDLNGGPYNPAAPFGGFKQSGLGREQGRFGIEEFVELKSLQFPIATR